MPNPYFNNFYDTAEQDLAESLVIEAIAMYGHECNYLPKTLVNYDDVYGEDTISTYSTHYELDFYIKSYDNYRGDGVFLSKFNLEIRDVLMVTIAIKTFRDTVTADDATITRPREGDLVYVPMDGRLYNITFVNKTPVFYQFGKIQFYDLTLELFEYSSERFDTGIAAIDNLYKNKSTDLNNFAILTQDGYMITDQNGYPILQSNYNLDTQSSDVFDDSEEIQNEADQILVWDEYDPFSEGNV